MAAPQGPALGLGLSLGGTVKQQSPQHPPSKHPALGVPEHPAPLAAELLQPQHGRGSLWLSLSSGARLFLFPAAAQQMGSDEPLPGMGPSTRREEWSPLGAPAG